MKHSISTPLLVCSCFLTFSRKCIQSVLRESESRQDAEKINQSFLEKNDSSSVLGLILMCCCLVPGFLSKSFSYKVHLWKGSLFSHWICIIHDQHCSSIDKPPLVALCRPGTSSTPQTPVISLVAGVLSLFLLSMCVCVVVLESLCSSCVGDIAWMLLIAVILIVHNIILCCSHVCFSVCASWKRKSFVICDTQNGIE